MTRIGTALVGDYRGLEVWKLAHQLVLAIYQATASFPAEERYGLVTQLRRAAVSIPVNIAEGAGRDGDVELSRYLQIALGSANEVESLLLLARDLGYLPQATWESLARDIATIKPMLARFVERLRPYDHRRRKGKGPEA